MVTNPNVSSDTFVITKNKVSRDMMRKVIIVAGLILFMVIGRSHGQEKKFYDAPLVGVKTKLSVESTGLRATQQAILNGKQ